MSSPDVQRIQKLEKELQEMKELQTREIQELKAQLSANAKNSEEGKEQFNKGLQEVKDLLNVNNAQLAHMEMLSVLKFYVETLELPKPPYSSCKIDLCKLQYTPALETFIRHGGIFHRSFHIETFIHGQFIVGGFIGYPHNFFDNFVKYCYETDKPEEIIGKLKFRFSEGTLWPEQLKPEQLKAGAMPTLVEAEEKDSNADSDADDDDDNEPWHCTYVKCWCCTYKMGNQHKPGVEFKLRIHFEKDAKYKKMRKFVLETKV